MNRQGVLCFTLGSPGELRGKRLIRKAEKRTVGYELFKILLVALQSGMYYSNIYVDRQLDKVSCVHIPAPQSSARPLTDIFND